MKDGISRTKTEKTRDISIQGRYMLEKGFGGNELTGIPDQNTILRSDTKQYARSHRERFPSDHVISENLDHDSDVEDRADDYTWQDVSDCFDKLAIIFFSVILVTSVTMFLLLSFLQIF